METVSVTVELFAFLDKFYPSKASKKPYCMQVPKGTTAGSIITGLKIPDDIPVLAYVNNIQLRKGDDKELKDGDTIGVMPVVPGG